MTSSHCSKPSNLDLNIPLRRNSPPFAYTNLISTCGELPSFGLSRGWGSAGASVFSWRLEENVSSSAPGHPQSSISVYELTCICTNRSGYFFTNPVISSMCFPHWWNSIASPAVDCAALNNSVRIEYSDPSISIFRNGFDDPRPRISLRVCSKETLGANVFRYAFSRVPT